MTARGEFNPYINAVFAHYMDQLDIEASEKFLNDEILASAFKLFEDLPRHIVHGDRFKEYMDTFVWGNREKILQRMNELSGDMWFSVLADNKESLFYIEKLLVGLLGHYDPEVRDSAVVHLNCFYDDSDWQMIQPLKPKVITSSSSFVIEEAVDTVIPEIVFLQLRAPSFNRNNKHYVMSLHIPEIQTVNKGAILKLDLGEFTRCGVYDWRFVTFENGSIRPLYSSFCARRGSASNFTSSTQTFPVQGRFIVHPRDVKDMQIHEIFVDFQDAQIDSKTGVITERGSFLKVKNSIKDRYATGINCLYLMGVFERDNGQMLENPDASPLSLICRSTPSKLLGGETEFSSLMKEAESIGMKIVVDAVARISSRNYHRRYKNMLLYTRNEKGLPVVCYGTDGRALNYEDSALLNYRQAEAWQLLVDDVIEVVEKYSINGVHMDNAQAWPQILELDRDEMYKLDSDGKYHYTTEEIFSGLIVKRNESYAYWASSKKDQYANPIFTKFCKEMWRRYPDFNIIADVWHGTGLEDRDRAIARSGPIPRLYDLPIKLASLFGKRLHKNGHIDPIERRDVTTMRLWYEERKRKMPEGAIMIQSSTGHSLPYPALLYGRGAWASVDLLFFMPDIPMTFIGEQAGFTYRNRITNIYDFDHDFTQQGIHRVASSKGIAQNLLVDSLPQVASAASLSVIPNMSEIIQQEDKYKQELGPEYGFDLSKIILHYKHCRNLRHEKEVLRTGELIPLVLRHDHGWHKHVMTFARCSNDEIAVVVINFNDHPVKGFLDLRNLASKIEEMDSAIFTIGQWFNAETDQLYFKDELLNDQHYVSLLPYKSEILVIYPSSESSQETIKKSIERLQDRFFKGLCIDGNYAIHNLLKCIEKDNPAQYLELFANNIGLIQSKFLGNTHISPLGVVKCLRKLNDKISARFLAYCDAINISPGDENPPKTFATRLVQENKFGPIVFAAPEMGRFSTAGGLGVMIDELSEGLAILGEEVWVISPYYERNKKGQSGYLTHDPANINWINNVDVQIGNDHHTIGVHRGYEKGVHLLFLHNAWLFPSIYWDGRGDWIMMQLVGFARGTLEALCHLGVIPSVLATNDWFSGLIAAYAKLGMFGETFKGTKFIHIVHNLDPVYEGRMYPEKHDGRYTHLHNLPLHLLIDPYWTREVVNASRCALIMSDQWATVSPSYKNELLSHSPLKELLKQKDRPFAFPNGIPKEQRLARLKDKGDHFNAKSVVQKKYFGFGDLDNSVVLISFVGRLCEQKGVHLIIDAAEQLIPRYNYKLQFLVGGQANYQDKYSADCARRLKELRSKYPHCFYANPDEFFTDGPWVNLGSDFGVMPSMFEPGGIVQHEFFVAGTPVIAFRTGGLKDTVFEFNTSTGEGSGFTFDNYNQGELIYAIERAINIYRNENLYHKLRENAYNATMDGATVSRAWCGEFYRLKGKMFYEPTERYFYLEKLKACNWTSDKYNPDLPINQNSRKVIRRSPSGAMIDELPSKRPSPPSEDSKRHVLFRYKSEDLKLKSVYLTGSFDNWQVRHSMSYDHTSDSWHVTLQLPKGKYIYKFVVEGVTWVHSWDHPTETDELGNTNNIITIE